MPYVWTMDMPATAQTAAKTLLQLKTSSSAPLEILEVVLGQDNITSSNVVELLITVSTGAFTAGTVTAGSQVKANQNDPASTCTFSTSACGYNASAEPSGGTSVTWSHRYWNLLNGEWVDQGVPGERLWVPASGLWTLKLNTAPAASTTIGGYVKVCEYQ